ncbi:MAG: hypothetical protein WA825_12055 [Steroidobacteraceae bacterium]
MVILTLNCGSTSVKSAWYSPRATVQERKGAKSFSATTVPREALRELTGLLGGPPAAVAHRIVHGGNRFVRHAIIAPEVIAALYELGELAPLHNPPALRWVRAAQEHWPDIPHIAVFDTVFFAAMPRVAREYALPAAMGVDLGVRRYGFHGLAHESMWHSWCARHPELPKGGRLITLQLGGGCSITASRGGEPLDTSMGFSPLEGLVMETRCGDIDASVVEYLQGRLGLPATEVIARLNRESGLVGLAGSGKWAELLAEESVQARFAFELYCYRIRKYVGSYLAVLQGCDGIVFGGGVGEHIPEVRAQALQGFEWAGLSLDSARNGAARGGAAQIAAPTSTIGIEVATVDEEQLMVKACIGLIGSSLVS